MDRKRLRQKLLMEIERVSWRPLVPHHDKGHLWLLAGDLELIEVALAVANDELAHVSGWIQSGQLRRPEAQEVDAWTADPIAQHFEFVIVQPFVFAIEHKGPEVV